MPGKVGATDRLPRIEAPRRLDGMRHPAADRRGPWPVSRTVQVVVFFVGAVVTFFSAVLSHSHGPVRISYLTDTDAVLALHKFALKCLRDSNSPYGYDWIPPRTRAARVREYHRMLNLTKFHRTCPIDTVPGWRTFGFLRSAAVGTSMISGHSFRFSCRG
jgi:hypothetical protein